jgi:hypothetical protein
MRSTRWLFLSTLLALTSLAASAQADDSADLSAKATDPTAALMSFQLLNWYTGSYHGVDESSNQLVFRAAIPFQAFGKQNIFRITQPYASSGPAGSGWVDTTVFNLTVFDEHWGRWGIGFDGTLPSGSMGLSTDKWTLGPALGFVNSATKGINWGLFTQTFFSVAGKDAAPDVGIVNIQPIFSYQLGKGRSLSLGNSALVYDTERSRWSSLQLGLNYGQVMSLWGHKWRPNAEIDYDFKDDHGNPKWIFRVGMVLLLPTH